MAPGLLLSLPKVQTHQHDQQLYHHQYTNKCDKCNHCNGYIQNQTYKYLDRHIPVLKKTIKDTFFGNTVDAVELFYFTALPFKTSEKAQPSGNHCVNNMDQLK